MHKHSYIDIFEYEGDEYKYVPRAKHKDILYTDPDGCASRKSTGWKAHKARHQWEHSVTNHTKGTPYIEERKSRKKRRQNLAVAK